MTQLRLNDEEAEWQRDSEGRAPEAGLQRAGRKHGMTRARFGARHDPNTGQLSRRELRFS